MNLNINYWMCIIDVALYIDILKHGITVITHIRAVLEVETSYRTLYEYRAAFRMIGCF